MIDEGIYLTAVALPADAPKMLWLTRDSDDISGELSEIIEVWAERPTRSPVPADLGLGACWLPSHEDHAGLVLRVHRTGAARYFGTLPESDRECIRHERG